MSHPEIPKDHPRFRIVHFDRAGEMDNYWAFIMRESFGRVSEQRLENLNDYQRQDAAAHAAAWWFNRSQEICDSENGDPLDMLKANEIAYAWLKWGAE